MTIYIPIELFRELVLSERYYTYNIEQQVLEFMTGSGPVLLKIADYDTLRKIYEETKDDFRQEEIDKLTKMRDDLDKKIEALVKSGNELD